MPNGNDCQVAIHIQSAVEMLDLLSSQIDIDDSADENFLDTLYLIMSGIT